MGCLWGVCGVFVGCLWVVCGLFLGCLWVVCGLFVGCLWVVCGLFVGCLWVVCGVFVGCLWGVCGVFMRLDVCERLFVEFSHVSLLAYVYMFVSIHKNKNTKQKNCLNTKKNNLCSAKLIRRD